MTSFDLGTLLTGALGGSGVAVAIIKMIGKRDELSSAERTGQAKANAAERKDVLEKIWEKNGVLEASLDKAHERLDRCQDDHRKCEALHKICEDKTARLEEAVGRLQLEMRDIQSASVPAKT